MVKSGVPDYATFEDYRSSQRIAVVVRWFLLFTFLALVNFRSDEAYILAFNAMGVALIIVNGYVHWRIFKDRPVTWPYVLILSLIDLSFITVGIGITNRFENTYFNFYYPALLGVALIFRRRISFAIVTIVAGVYTGMSLAFEPGVDTSVLFDGDEKLLTVRVISMFAIVVAANLMTRLELQRRREAVSAERARMEENIQLEQKAQAAEQEVQRERIRISHEIHDGAAQTAYVLSLGLETCMQLTEGSASQLQEKLKALHTQSKHALWELRYVAVQDKCPFKWPAEMSPGQAAMVSDVDPVGPAQGCCVGGPSAARYFLMVALWIPNSRSIALSDIPLRLAF